MLEPASREQLQLGATTVTFLPDGEVYLNPTALFPKSAPDGWAAYAPYLGSDGRLPISVGSILIRKPSHTVLIDLGLGAVDFDVPEVATFRGGQLLKSLHDEGLTPEDVDHVLFTHLHHDHVGWTTDVAPSPNAGPKPVTGLTFARAVHHVAEAEWAHWLGTSELTGPDPRAVQDPLADAVRFLEPHTEVVPGIRSLPTAGHTPGHTSFIVSDSGTDERLVVLGDVMHTQAQISDPEWNFLFDVDPEHGTAARKSVLAAFGDGHTLIAGGHFAGSVFGRFRPAALRHGWLTGPGRTAAA